MKTKIIYISGNEIFDMADIRAAFEEVRNALNLDKNTVLFGVPVDNEDAGLMESGKKQPVQQEPEVDIEKDIKITTPIEPVEVTITQPEIGQEINPDIIPEVIPESSKEPVKKRGRARKNTPEIKTEDIDTQPDDTPIDVDEKLDEKVVPILSILSSKDNPDVIEKIDEKVAKTTALNTDIEIIEDIVQETKAVSEPDDLQDVEEIIESDEIEGTNEPDLEKLLSAMKPLQEDILDNNITPVPHPTEDEEESIDATLEQLATEFVQTQDKIASESKTSGRGRIGKLRNILPFKQSKHKDQGLGDLFGWAGVAANDEDFSVPGFFTNASQKK